jgi:chemotaxis protein methyltransferase CheR
MPAALPAPAWPTAAADPEFHLSAADFARIRELIHARAGISLHEGKQAMVYSRLSRRLRETRHPDFAAYLGALERQSGPAADAEWQEFVNCLTTNLTSFFREEHHFHALRDDLLTRRGAPLRIWCAAASTGEEPYSIAMTVAETLGSAASQVPLLCTDIDTSTTPRRAA